MKAAAFAIAFATAVCPPLPSQAASEDQMREAREFALGNVVWVLYHEIGHLLIDAFQLPVLGREEDAVDNLATLILLEERSPLKDTFLVATVDAFFLMGEEDRGERTFAYHGHGFSEQRAFQVSCLMLGSDPVAFAAFADTARLPPERRKTCPHEYQKSRSSWFGVLAPFRASWWGRSGEVDIAYEPASGRLGHVPGVLKSAQVLEVAAQYLRDGFALPQPYRLVARECGESNAYYEPGSATVIVCYELFDFFDRLLLDHYRATP